MISKIVRRTHMYLALFLTPWMLMYALSTLAMNHRDFFSKRSGEGAISYEKESEQIYRGTWAPDTAPKMKAQQILKSLNMEGRHDVRESQNGKTLTINRHDPVLPRRISFSVADGRLTVERQVFRTVNFLERMHRRSGYDSGYAVDSSWAFAVDLVITAMIFWGLSGLWLWWELRVTRRLGLLCAGLGFGLFGFFLLTI
jgi:hypothetical protein